jgi:two-component system cell cycle response regulator
MRHGSTILIVDDEPAGRDTLEALLMVRGYDLAFASDGPEALAKAAELTPDVILLDVMMPGMDGFEVCQHLRSDPLLTEVPVIMVTALDDRDSRLRGIEVGADDFVTKPFDRAELRARVRTITRLNRYRRLLTERTKFEWVVEQADDGYLIVSDSGRVLYANPQARLYLGLPSTGSGQAPAAGSGRVPADKGKPIAETFLELARKQYHCEPQEAWATWPEQSAVATRTPRYLVRPESLTAQAFWLQVDVRDLPSGPDTGWIVRLRDVTAQMDLQRDRRGFHAAVSHKLRTPLTGMLNSLELLMEHTSELSRADIADFSERAFKGVQRLHGEIEDILQYLETPGLAQPGARFNLSQLQPVVAEISAELGLESVAISGQEGLGEVWVVLSQQAVELVLWEILENAKKFHPKQAPTVEVLIARSGPKGVSIQVCDDGLTLSPEQLALVWTPYYQGEKYFTGQVSGMGLGLSMVASLVWGVGGTCHIHNREKGPGVVVELVLPLAENGGAGAVNGFREQIERI